MTVVGILMTGGDNDCSGLFLICTILLFGKI